MRRNTLYGPRVRGDLELGLEPSRVVGAVKDWARADFPGEHIPGMPEQEIGAESELANYRIGTRRVQDERTFHYCRADTNYGIEKAYYGAQDFNVYKNDGSEDCWEGTVYGAHTAATYELTTADDNTRHTANWFAGGWVWLYDADWIPRWYRIRSSTDSATTPSGYVTLTLWDPLVTLLAGGEYLSIYPSIYSKVQRRGLGQGCQNAPTVCVAPIRVQVGYHFWGQTWGPCVGTPNVAVPGADNNERFLVFNFDGSLRLQIAPVVDHYEQLAGFNLLGQGEPGLYSAPAQGWFPYMLQLSP